MLRAISEIAVAILVRSEPPKPSSVANERPVCRANTMSAAELIETCVSRSICVTCSIFKYSLLQSVQMRQALFHIRRGLHALQIQTQLHHHTGNIGVDTDYDRFCSALFEHVCHRTQ